MRADPASSYPNSSMTYESCAGHSVDLRESCEKKQISEHACRARSTVSAMAHFVIIFRTFTRHPWTLEGRHLSPHGSRVGRDGVMEHCHCGLECGMQPFSPDLDEPGADPAEKAALVRVGGIGFYRDLSTIQHSLLAAKIDTLNFKKIEIWINRFIRRTKPNYSVRHFLDWC